MYPPFPLYAFPCAMGPVYEPGVPSPKSMFASFLMTRITAGVLEIPGLRAIGPEVPQARKCAPAARSVSLIRSHSSGSVPPASPSSRAPPVNRIRGQRDRCSQRQVSMPRVLPKQERETARLAAAHPLQLAGAYGKATAGATASSARSATRSARRASILAGLPPPRALKRASPVFAVTPRRSHDLRGERPLRGSGFLAILITKRNPN